MDSFERLGEVDRRAAERHEELRAELGRVAEALALVLDDDTTHRRGLEQLRRSPEYERAFDNPSPLVSVLIPTWDRLDSLIERALSSVLDQTHTNLEVVVVGDGIPAGREATVRDALESLGDARVRFENTTVNGPYPDDPRRKWMMVGTPPLNHGRALLRGDWHFILDDDDALRPDALERLVAFAQHERLEFAYGKLLSQWGEGRTELLGVFPPESGQVGFQSGILHGGLRLIPIEPGHQIFGLSNDVGFIRRMMRLGVRMGMLDAVVVDYFPSMDGLGAFDGETTHGSSTALAAADTRAAEATRRALRAEADLAAAQLDLVSARQRATELEADLADARYWLDELRQSTTWRLTGPLRRIISRWLQR